MIMLNVALLWHMHQPYYVNPLTKSAMMPWVRLHAVKGYLDMAEMARRHPSTRMVFNLTPVLVKQIHELVTGEVKDVWEEWSRIPAAELPTDIKRNILEHFFKANWDHLIRPHPRYHELLTRRGYDLQHVSLDAMISSFSKQDYLDLQVWYNLAWCGYAACAEFPELRELKAKGRNFTEADKTTLLDIHHKILASVLPRYRALAKSGSVEISTTPFFHPISPLVMDTEFAHRAMPMAALPPRFHWPDDIEAHLRLAIAQHEKHFGAKPRGLWPSEGSVCPEMIPLLAHVGFQWFATDEDILFRSDARESGGHMERVRLYEACEAEFKGAVVPAIFRDRSLSDFIGFSAAKNRPDEAAAFIMRHVQGIATATEKRSDPIVAIVLDGENAWEYFADGGEGFLDALYRQLGNSEKWKTTTLADFVSRPVTKRRLTQLHTGSWIQGNFDIWIGDPEENLGWQLLGETRQWWEKKKHSVSPETAERVWMEIYAAEGSDWFWWYGPDFQTDNDLLFDELFRTHLQNVYRLCGAEPPEALLRPVCRPALPSSAMLVPIGLITPKLDGIVTTFFEWHEAGRYDVAQSHGSMFHAERIARAIFYGFDTQNLYIRLDPYPDTAKQSDLKIRLRIHDTHLFDFHWSPATGVIAPAQHPSPHAHAAYRKIVEIAVALSAVSVREGEHLRFHISILKDGLSATPTELEHHPVTGFFEFTVPGEKFAAENWSA